MANMQLNKTPMPAQEPCVRTRNFDEVVLSYTAEMAVNEANRCLGCKTSLAYPHVLSVLIFLHSLPRWPKTTLDKVR